MHQVLLYFHNSIIRNMNSKVLNFALIRYFQGQTHKTFNTHCNLSVVKLCSDSLFSNKTLETFNIHCNLTVFLSLSNVEVTIIKA